MQSHSLGPVGLLVLATALSGGSCGPSAPASLVPANYRATFTRVRNCRATIEHLVPDGRPTRTSAIVVYVNPEAAAAYNANASPLPANTLVIKEEHDDPGCTHVIAYSVSHKEAGFDPMHGDWHWQHVLANGTIEGDGHDANCMSAACHSAPACLARDWMCTEP